MTAVVFDLDGTLVHSAPDIHAAVNVVLEERGIAPLGLDVVTTFIGNGVPKLVERVVSATGIDGREYDQVLERFSDVYGAAPDVLTVPYPGVIESLATLKASDHSLGVCTNKPITPTKAILDKLGLRHRFSAVFGGDSFEKRKPDPMPLLGTFAALGRANGIYVGDSEVDAACAQAAGVPFALFSGGYRKADIGDLAHSAVFHDFAELPAVIHDLSDA